MLGSTSPLLSVTESCVWKNPVTVNPGEGRSRKHTCGGRQVRTGEVSALDIHHLSLAVVEDQTGGGQLSSLTFLPALESIQSTLSWFKKTFFQTVQPLHQSRRVLVVGVLRGVHGPSEATDESLEKWDQRIRFCTCSSGSFCFFSVSSVKVTNKNNNPKHKLRVQQEVDSDTRSPSSGLLSAF